MPFTGTSLSASQLMEKEEKRLVQDSWGNVEKRMRLDGTRIFIKLFEKYPHTKKMFPDFEHISSEDLKHNWRLKAHVLRVATAMQLIINCLDSDKAIDSLTKVTANLHHMRGVRRPDFEAFNSVFKEYISYVVKNEKSRAAWDKALTIMTKEFTYDDPTKVHLY